jgi:hypothetical protein
MLPDYPGWPGEIVTARVRVAPLLWDGLFGRLSRLFPRPATRDEYWMFDASYGSVTSSGIGVMPIVAADPLREYLALQSLGGQVISLGLDVTVSATKGLAANLSVNPITFDRDSAVGLCAAAWFAYFPAAALTVSFVAMQRKRSKRQIY